MKQTWLGEYYDLEDNFENLRSELSDISSSKIGATQDANSVVRQFQEFERKVAPYLEIPNRIQHQIDLTKRVFGREGARLHAEKDAIKKSEELSMLLEGARNELGDSIASCFEDKLVCYSLLEHSTDIESLKSKRTELDELSDAYFSLFATQDSDKEKIKVKRTRKNVRILNYAEDMKRREKVLQIFRGLKEIYESRKWKSKDEKRFLKNLTKDCNSIARKFRRLKYQEGALEAKVLEGEILDEINESTKSTQNNKREYQYKKFGKWATLGLAGLGAATFLALSGWGLVNSARQVSQEQYKPTASQVQTHQTSQTYQTSQAFETSQEGERITEFFYEDVPKNYRYKDSIQKVTELGLMNGYPDGTFRPYSDVDKFQFAMALARTLTYLEESEGIKCITNPKVTIPKSISDSYAGLAFRFLREREIIGMEYCGEAIRTDRPGFKYVSHRDTVRILNKVLEVYKTRENENFDTHYKFVDKDAKVLGGFVIKRGQLARYLDEYLIETIHNENIG